MTKPDEDTKTGDALLDRAKPAEFPLDVWGAAVAAVSAGPRDERRLESVARAIVAERERCAAIADAVSELLSEASTAHKERGDTASMYSANTAWHRTTEIAAAIRSGKQ